MRLSSKDACTRSLYLIGIEEWDEALLWTLVLEMSAAMPVKEFGRCIMRVEKYLQDLQRSKKKGNKKRDVTPI